MGLCISHQYFFSHNNFCLIPITFKKNDETVLVPCRNLSVTSPAYDECMQPNNSMYCFITSEVGVGNDNCVVAVCSMCIEFRNSLVENDAYLYKKAHVFCPEHVNSVITEERYTKMESLMR